MAQPCSINNAVRYLKPCLQSESNDLVCLTQILSLWKDCKEPVEKPKMSQNANSIDARFEMLQDGTFILRQGKIPNLHMDKKSVIFLKILLILIWSM